MRSCASPARPGRQKPLKVRGRNWCAVLHRRRIAGSFLSAHEGLLLRCGPAYNGSRAGFPTGRGVEAQNRRAPALPAPQRAKARKWSSQLGRLVAKWCSPASQNAPAPDYANTTNVSPAAVVTTMYEDWTNELDRNDGERNQSRQESGACEGLNPVEPDVRPLGLVDLLLDVVSIPLSTVARKHAARPWRTTPEGAGSPGLSVG